MTILVWQLALTRFFIDQNRHIIYLEFLASNAEIIPAGNHSKTIGYGSIQDPYDGLM
ncbi:hypothetical protein JX360_00375 [Synechococcus bigranulatus str. 'Rupite']|uniref:Uncharacterized protein n=2 Tax=Thermostichus vulcanus TaxID=32053 RepID=A0ABT0C6F2_THEVL|nr:hypothetical protein [Thermostichus vulcanus str. 'Rupite']